ncbi:hypothetical protein AC1031_020070 [Aphanomyces cochlioides]|nr:hypothetical protein AC1031_020070 [Aphanomyces cochlioides]
MEGTAETIAVFDVVTSKIRDAFANEMRTSTATNDAEVLNRFMLYLWDTTTVSNLDGLAMLAQAFLWNDPATAGSFIEQGTPVVIVAARAPPNSDQSKSRPLRTIHGHMLHQNSVTSHSPKYSPTARSLLQPRPNPVSAPQSQSPRRNNTQKTQQRLQPMFSSSSSSIASVSPRFESESSTHGGLLPSLSHTLPFILSSTTHHVHSPPRSEKVPPSASLDLCCFRGCRQPAIVGTIKCAFHRHRSLCSVEGCSHQAYARQLCIEHGGKDLCVEKGCKSRRRVGLTCSKHSRDRHPKPEVARKRLKDDNDVYELQKSEH